VQEPQVIDMDTLRFSPTAVLFEGGRFGDIQATSFIVATPPGGGVGRHVHPYPEVFIVLKGQVTFRVGDRTFEAHANQIVIGPAEMPHGFTNTGAEPLSIVSIHVNDHLIQEFLEP
jgi:mannose-6-phosphate isomerase-like protein (cupin superfamily)